MPWIPIIPRGNTVWTSTNPKETYVLRALPGRTFSTLQLICIMYAGFKRIEPGIDIGVELGEEWGIAESLGTEKKGL